MDGQWQEGILRIISLTLLSPLTLRLAQRIWAEWQKQCLKTCDDDVRRYWVCRQEQGMMTPFNCRADNEEMKVCLQTCGRDQIAFDAFREKRLDELESLLVAKQLRDAAATAAAAATVPPVVR